MASAKSRAFPATLAATRPRWRTTSRIPLSELKQVKKTAVHQWCCWLKATATRLSYIFLNRLNILFGTIIPYTMVSLQAYIVMLVFLAVILCRYFWQSFCAKGIPFQKEHTITTPRTASDDPKKRFTGLPREIRDMIYELLLVKSSAIIVPFGPGDLDHDTALMIPEHDLIHPQGNVAVGLQHVTSIIRVNKQLEDEATYMLYAKNVYNFYFDPSFNRAFFKSRPAEHSHDTGIGRINAAKIKTATFAIPNGIIYGMSFARDHTQVLDLICGRLTGLRKLELTSLHLCPKPDPTKSQFLLDCLNVKIEQCHHVRALLKTAARITKYHPTLRRSIWHRWSGSQTLPRYFPDDRLSLYGQWYIHLVPDGPSPALHGNGIKQDCFGHDFTSKVSRRSISTPSFHTYNSVQDFVINSLKTRQTCWTDLSTFSKLSNFKMDGAPSSSETTPDEVTTWPGVDIYHPWSEYDDSPRAGTMVLAGAQQILEELQGPWDLELMKRVYTTEEHEPM